MAINLKGFSSDQLRALIRKAKKREKDLSKERVAKVRSKVLALIKSEKLTVDEVFPGRGRPSRKGRKLGKVKPKYRNPGDPGQTWTGRGKRPRWFAAALAGGKKEKDLLI
jgi:DNA-binding protein H-NS